MNMALGGLHVLDAAGCLSSFSISARAWPLPSQAAAQRAVVALHVLQLRPYGRCALRMVRKLVSATAQPASVDVSACRSAGLVTDGLLGSSWCRRTGCRRPRYQLPSRSCKASSKLLDGLLQVDDIDAVLRSVKIYFAILGSSFFESGDRSERLPRLLREDCLHLQKFVSANCHSKISLRSTICYRPPHTVFLLAIRHIPDACEKRTALHSVQSMQRHSDACNAK